MQVVNVKVKYIRPEYDNIKEWRTNPNHCYIGRKGIVFINGERYPKRDSMWCNPYKVGKYTREEALALYEEHLRRMLKDKDTLAEFKELKDKTLGCWCVEPGKNIQCHGHIIIKLLKEYD